ncbi:MAG: hypothetical protein EBS06_05705 [Proteobacteria bacterium]|nr:hypothetical protein [Pseudomonadota bacterium]
MSKAILLKSVIILAVLSVFHSVFWFFKTGQIEKQINSLISENSSYVSAGEISVSGFPLKQRVSIKDLKITLPNPAFSKYQIDIKNLIATSGIFSGDFSVTLNEQVSVLDTETNISGLLEFNKEPEIKALIAKDSIAKFSYKDSGHRVLDAEKNTIYAASTANFSFESTLEEGDKIKNKITVDLKDIEGFDILSVYKNSSEKKVIEGIKTGEIAIGNSTSAAAAPVDTKATPPITAPTTTATANNTVNPTPADIAKAATLTDSSAKNTKPEEKPEDMTAALNNNLVKSNFAMDVDYTLVPNQGEQQTQNDPTQIQESPVQYSRAIKVNSLEFSNPLYKISINGEFNLLQDDSLPSGAVTLKIEKVSNLVNHITAGLNQIADQKKIGTVAAVKAADLNSSNTAPTTTATTNTVATNVATPSATTNNSAPDASAASAAITPSAAVAVNEDSYQIFVRKFAAGLDPVVKEISAKNPLSKDDNSVFDIRREKNIEFLINETSVREILGKF